MCCWVNIYQPTCNHLFTCTRDLCHWAENDQVRADGKPAGADQAVPVLPPCGAQSESPAGGRRGPLLLGSHEGAGELGGTPHHRRSIGVDKAVIF